MRSVTFGVMALMTAAGLLGSAGTPVEAAGKRGARAGATVGFVAPVRVSGFRATPGWRRVSSVRRVAGWRRGYSGGVYGFAGRGFGAERFGYRSNGARLAYVAGAAAERRPPDYVAGFIATRNTAAVSGQVRYYTEVGYRSP